jgi:acetate---CoA ligase (ADP-forming)
MTSTSTPAAGHPLAPLFSPRSVAIVGASEKSTWTIIMRQCMQGYGFEGRTFAVNRSGAAVFGWPGFISCSDIGEPVDAAYICVPFEGVYEALEDVARAGINAAVVLSSGYAETGVEGARLQRQLADRATELGVRMLGPNCLGFANVTAHTAITAIPPRGALLPAGGVGFVCQSGATAAELLEFTQQLGIGVSFFAATGNEAQISIADVVDYLIDDAGTRVIMLFAETIRHAPRFAAAARRALTAGKPIVALKVGSSELAASVARAHTGSMVGDDRVFDAACRQLGVIRVNSLEDLVVTAGLLAQTGPLGPGGAGVASISGGACTLIGDQAEVAGLPLPAFAPQTLARLRDVLPDYAGSLNPLDVTGAYVRDTSILEKTLAIIGADPAVALRLCVMNLPFLEGMTTPTPAMFASVGRGLAQGSTPGLLVVQTIKPVTDVSRRIMREHGIPGVTGGLDHAVRAAGRAIWWSQRYREQRPGNATTDANIAVAAPAPAAANTDLTPDASAEREILDYLATFGVPVIPATIARSAEAAAAAARQYGGRVALKVASPDIAHKTEVGGVRLRLEGDAAVRTAWHEIDASVRTAAPQARIDGISVAPMREAGIELFVGTARDPDWGRVIVVGLGGIWVEALQDTALRVLPVAKSDVLEMLGSLRGAQLLRGFRGAPPADLDAIADAIVRVGTAALGLPAAAASLEINPLLVDGARVEALDALLTWD